MYTKDNAQDISHGSGLIYIYIYKIIIHSFTSFSAHHIRICKHVTNHFISNITLCISQLEKQRQNLPGQHIASAVYEGL